MKIKIVIQEARTRCRTKVITARWWWREKARFSADRVSTEVGDWLNVEGEEKTVSSAWIFRFIYSKSYWWPVITVWTILLLLLSLGTELGPGNKMKCQTWNPPCCLAKILAFSAHWSWMKNMETEFGGNKKVAFILRQQKCEHSRLCLRDCAQPPWGSLGLK